MRTETYKHFDLDFKFDVWRKMYNSRMFKLTSSWKFSTILNESTVSFCFSPWSQNTDPLTVLWREHLLSKIHDKNIVDRDVQSQLLNQFCRKNSFEIGCITMISSQDTSIHARSYFFIKIICDVNAKLKNQWSLKTNLPLRSDLFMDKMSVKNYFDLYHIKIRWIWAVRDNVMVAFFKVESW